MGDWHVHVFTSTYTADVSGVCSAMYELGGMSILHDPSGCNSTYTTHDEPRWFGSESLMFVSGLDEITAVMGDDSVIIDDVCEAAADLKPRFITLCGASIPHIIAFDYKGVARLIENRTGIPCLAVPTDGLQMYTRGVGLALREWIKRFADFSIKSEPETVNLLGVTPIDFSRQEIVDSMKSSLEKRGLKVNAVCAMGDTFENMQKVCRASVNVVVSSAGLLPAKLLKARAGIPYVIGTPVGSLMTDYIADLVRLSESDGQNRYAYDAADFAIAEVTGSSSDNDDAELNLLVIGEDVCANSLAAAANLHYGAKVGEANAAGAEYGEAKNLRVSVLCPDPDEGIDEDELVRRIRNAKKVICDPLYLNAFGGRADKLISLPHEGYSGRIFRDDIPVFTGDSDFIAKAVEAIGDAL